VGGKIPGYNDSGANARDAMASKGLLRHTNLATTTRHYVKDVPENTLSAMNQLESLFSDKHSGRPN